MLVAAIFCALLAGASFYTICRASSKCGRAEREREDEIIYLELLLRSDEEPRV